MIILLRISMMMMTMMNGVEDKYQVIIMLIFIQRIPVLDEDGGQYRCPCPHHFQIEYAMEFS